MCRHYCECGKPALCFPRRGRKRSRKARAGRPYFIKGHLLCRACHKRLNDSLKGGGLGHRRRVPVRQCKKRYCRKCCFCGEAEYAALDAHRVVPGKDGGSYVWQNVLVTCASCHRKVHDGVIEVVGIHEGSSGRRWVNYIENGKEYWVREASLLDRSGEDKQG